MQVPNFVAERWKSVCAAHSGEDAAPTGPELGHITWEAGTSGSDEAQMQLTLTREKG